MLTTKITPELTQKLTYRYYEFDNDTPRIIFPCWISYDGTGATITPSHNACGGSTTAGTGFEKTISSLTISYIKQDAGYELNWRPSPEWNFNAAGGWERYNYTQTDVDATNEFSGKASVDWKPTVWLTARASGYYSDRRYDTYGYNTFVSPVQFPTVPRIYGDTTQQLVLCAGLSAIHVRQSRADKGEPRPRHRGISRRHDQLQHSNTRTTITASIPPIRKASPTVELPVGVLMSVGSSRPIYRSPLRITGRNMISRCTTTPTPLDHLVYACGSLGLGGATRYM